MQFGLANILFFIGIGIAVPFTMLFAGWLLRPNVPESQKALIYECGEEPVEQAWFNFNPRFYIVALIFLIFDVEVAFTYPVAVAFRRFVALGQGGFAFLELLVFILILVLGLAYVWKHGDLEWIRRARADAAARRSGRD
ncbi:MAG: NADH-quinone oxidoreductase subunit A [Myxococcales bacterium]|nr:NADH-quinone oxidoreductase subunit A [Myxococcales bacterium]